MELAIYLGNLRYFNVSDISIILCVLVSLFHLIRFHKRYSWSHISILVTLLILCGIYEVLDKIYDSKTANGTYQISEIFDAAWGWFEASVVSFICAAISIIHEISAKYSLREFMINSISNDINKNELLIQAKIHIMAKWERAFSRNAVFWFVILALISLSICGFVISKGI